MTAGQSAAASYAVHQSVDAIYLTQSTGADIGMSGNVGTYVVTPQSTTEYRLKVVDGSITTLTQPVRVTVTKSQTVIGIHPALPALPFHQRLGVHTLNRIEEAREAFELGCRSFTSLDNITGAREMRARGAAVIVRRFVDHGVVPGPEGFARGFGLGREDEMMAMGLNEADNLSTSDLPTRFNWDRPWAETMHQLYPRCFILIGSFSMGTPAIEVASVAKVWRDTYAPFLNANSSWCGINYHNYHRRHDVRLPPTSTEVQEPKWWPTRFVTWAYDPSLGGLNQSVVLVDDESGVDIGGVGGFKACGYNDDTFAIWWSLHRSLFEWHPQQYVFNIFQLSNNTRWDGYNARAVLGGMTKVWRGQAVAMVEPAMQVYVEAAGDSESQSPVDPATPKDFSDLVYGTE